MVKRLQGCLLLLTLIGCAVPSDPTPPGPGPQPVDPGDITPLVREGMNRYRKSLSQSYLKIADDLDAGRINVSQSIERAEAESRQARAASFNPIEQKFQDRFPTPESGDPEIAARMFRQMAEGVK